MCRFSLEEEVTQNSYVAVRSKSEMDDTLFRDNIRNVIILLYPTISNEYIIKDGKIIQGPVILKYM